MKLNLYTINPEIENIVFFDEETGEILETIDEQISSLNFDPREKALCLAKKSDEFEREAEVLKNKIREWAKRAKSLEGASERLKTQIKSFVTEGEKLKDDEISISWRKSTGVEIDDNCDLTQLPTDYIRCKVEADKTKLKKAIEAGEIFEGIKLSERQTLQIK